MFKSLCAFLLLLCIAPFPGGGLHAQAPLDDQITDDVIFFDAPVEDTITQRSIYDRWRFYGEAGDVFIITMQGMDGLAPLIGVMGERGNVIAASNISPAGELLQDAEPDGITTLEFTAPQSLEYSIIATRVGNDTGTTTGSYQLVISQVGTLESLRDAAQDVTFRCGEDIITNALAVTFPIRAAVDTYRISVYGLEDFQPMIRAVAGADRDFRDCASDAQQMGDDAFTLPDELTLQLPPEESHENAAQLALRGVGLLNRAEITVGSVDGGRGRYVVVMDGFSLEAGQEDMMQVWLGPLAASGEVLVYMVQMGNSRLDPLLTLLVEGDDDDIFCDDAGRRGCEDVPALVGFGVEMNDGTMLSGGRFDAGLRLSPGAPEQMTLVFSSRNANAAGDYAIIFIGELPGGELPE